MISNWKKKKKQGKTHVKIDNEVQNEQVNHLAGERKNYTIV